MAGAKCCSDHVHQLQLMLCLLTYTRFLAVLITCSGQVLVHSLTSYQQVLVAVPYAKQLLEHMPTKTMHGL